MNKIKSEIKKNVVGFHLGGGIFLLLLGLVIVFASNTHIFTYIFSSKPDLFAYESSELKPGKWYKCDNNVLWGYFASDNHGRYYVANTNDGYYIGFYVDNKYNDIADKISDQTYACYNGEADSLSDLYISGTGYIEEMEASEQRYFKSFFEYDDESIDNYQVRYLTFRVTSFGELLLDDHGHSDTFYIIIGILCIVGGIFLIIKLFIGGYMKDFNKSMETYNITNEMLDQDMVYARKFGPAYIGSNYLVMIGLKSYVLPITSLIWAYVLQTDTQHKLYGIIPTGTTTSYSVVMWDRNRKKIEFNINKKEEGHTLLEELQARAPYILYGFSNDLANATNSGQFNTLIQAVDQRRAEYQQQDSSMDSGVINYDQGQQDPNQYYQQDPNQYQQDPNQYQQDPNQYYQQDPNQYYDQGSSGN
ncbi:MAG: hypothetical protein K6E10_05490 [Eubacterium sp.]|nr:hypothetical protein [Eubacterium sp.]